MVSEHQTNKAHLHHSDSEDANRTGTILDLLAPLSVLPGVSTRRMKLFEKLGVRTLWDALRLFPVQYEDWRNTTALAEIKPGQNVVFLATICKAPTLQYKGKRSIIRSVLQDGSGQIGVIWFNQAYLMDRLHVGQTYLFRGKIQNQGRYLNIVNPTFVQQTAGEGELKSPLEDYALISSMGAKKQQPADTAVQGAEYKPIYPLTAGLTQGVVRGVIDQILKQYIGQLCDILPQGVRRQWQLYEMNDAYRVIHHPPDAEALEAAKKRLIFEELFMVQLGLSRIKKEHQSQFEAVPICLTDEQIEAWQHIKNTLPFVLTEGQKKALRDLLSDMTKSRPMNRLVQGDVGSGKTVIAALALAAVCLAGYQGVMMAPTSILAQQHYETLQRQIGDVIRVGLLTGKTTAKARQTLLSELADGRLQVLVGTHALIQEGIHYKALALAITDEQHRFGVRQRIRLVQEGDLRPHVCVMSATPIPRSLGLILYGDLDISIVHERPPGRQPIQTYIARPTDRERVYQLMRKAVKAGNQCYLICPAVHASESELSLQTATSIYETFNATVFPDLRIGLVHGKLKEAEKQLQMEAFKQGEIDILVATTVVEVGVDNPNATVMVIENASRFGLSQLHQLRGRIGRGSAASICILMDDLQSERARERLRTLCQTDDGFELAEADLALRGPGDFFGTRQHGLPEFKLANLYEHRELLEAAKEAMVWLGEHRSVLNASEGQQLAYGMQMMLGISPETPGL